MKTYLFAILMVFNWCLFSQEITIDYHVGYDCQIEFDNKEHRGGCWRNETINYSICKKAFKSSDLYIRKRKSTYDENGFGVNLEPDSTEIVACRKRINIEVINQLIELLNQVESLECETNTCSFYSTWNLKVFGINYSKRKQLEKIAKKKKCNYENLLETIGGYYNYMNKFFVVSSAVKSIKIIIDFNGFKYYLHHSQPGGTNLLWEINFGGREYQVISPRLNMLIADVLPRQMPVKKKLLEFTRIEKLVGSFEDYKWP